MRGFYRYENSYAMQYDIYQILYFNITEMCLISGINSTTYDFKKNTWCSTKIDEATEYNEYWYMYHQSVKMIGKYTVIYKNVQSTSIRTLGWGVNIFSERTQLIKINHDKPSFSISSILFPLKLFLFFKIVKSIHVPITCKF